MHNRRRPLLDNNTFVKILLFKGLSNTHGNTAIGVCSTVVTSADLEIMVGALCGGMSVLSALVRIDKQRAFVTRNRQAGRS